MSVKDVGPYTNPHVGHDPVTHRYLLLGSQNKTVGPCTVAVLVYHTVALSDADASEKLGFLLTLPGLTIAILKSKWFSLVFGDRGLQSWRSGRRDGDHGVMDFVPRTSARRQATNVRI